MNNELVRPEVIRVDEEDLDFIKLGTYIGAFFNYKGKPFTGYVVMGYYENNNIHLEYEYFEGEMMGWEVEYHENGKVKEKTLMYGATTVVYYEYDEQGNELDGGFIEPKSLYNKCARLTGMELIEEDDE